ncbi:hypothetical protein Goshw_020286 [Gossypium schwendimanii]|uniref:Uncharacterized protein n=1 Tax=Gossypium schwendimanii TaxID=34291 RepID=A0A7J9LH48_GOSSC|nr:hypothetical protein [Gossypium schwendimanii]
MEFELVIERIEKGYLERFEERVLGFGEVVVVESNISSHLFLVLNGGDRRGFQGIRHFLQPALPPIPNWWWSRLIGTLPGNQGFVCVWYD